MGLCVRTLCDNLGRKPVENRLFCKTSALRMCRKYIACILQTSLRLLTISFWQPLRAFFTEK